MWESWWWKKHLRHLMRNLATIHTYDQSGRRPWYILTAHWTLMSQHCNASFPFTPIWQLHNALQHLHRAQGLSQYGQHTAVHTVSRSWEANCWRGPERERERGWIANLLSCITALPPVQVLPHWKRPLLHWHHHTHLILKAGILGKSRVCQQNPCCRGKNRKTLGQH